MEFKLKKEVRTSMRTVELSAPANSDSGRRKKIASVSFSGFWFRSCADISSKAKQGASFLGKFKCTSKGKVRLYYGLNMVCIWPRVALLTSISQACELDEGMKEKRSKRRERECMEFDVQWRQGGFT